MKRIASFIIGMVLGGTVLGGPLVAVAQTNTTLEQRVQRLEERFHTLCFGASVERPRLYTWLQNSDVC